MKRLFAWYDKFIEDQNFYPIFGISSGAFVFYLFALHGYQLHADWRLLWQMGGIFGVIFGIGVILRKAWARWVGIAWCVCMISAMVAQAIWKDLSLPLMSAIGIACFGWYTFQIWNNAFDRSRDDDSDTAKPMVSLVFLLREPRFVDSTMLATLASRAWNLPVEDAAADDESDNNFYVVGESPMFIAKHPEATFLIYNFDRPYFDNSEEVAQCFSEMRTREAIRQHCAWLSVDAMHLADGPMSMPFCYRLLARLLAELADSNVLALFDPQSHQVFCYDPETESKLRSDDPVRALGRQYYAPIVQVAADDAAMAEAVDVARQRWHEFEAAFERRDPNSDSPFVIKAKFAEGDHAEYMWVTVGSIENGLVHGVLENDPAEVHTVARGDKVTVPVPDVNDWLCAINGKAVGGFTLSPMSEHMHAWNKDDEGAW